MKKYLFPFLLIVVALSLSAIAGYFSIIGLSKLFSGAAVAVIIMATALEVGKVVTVAFLHIYWKKTKLLMKIYLVIGALFLMGLTSVGIYGFLTSSYSITSAVDQVTSSQISVINLKRDRFQQSLDDYIIEKETINESIGELRDALSHGTRIEYVDEETGEIISTTSRATRESFENQLAIAMADRDSVSVKIEALTDSITSLDLNTLQLEVDNIASNDLGPLKYIAKITGKPMDSVVNWLMLVIIFFFDPLALCLMMAALFAFGSIKKSHELSKVVEYKVNQDKNKLDLDKELKNSPNDDEYFDSELNNIISSLNSNKQVFEDKPENILCGPPKKNWDEEINKVFDFSKDVIDHPEILDDNNLINKKSPETRIVYASESLASEEKTNTHKNAGPGKIVYKHKGKGGYGR